MKKVIILISIFFSMLSANLFAQHQIDSTEITSSVPELSAFHDVIYLIWHEAYPAKDVKALVGYTGQIKTDIGKINSAVLPGILRDKEMKWKEGLTDLNAAAEKYYKAAQGSDMQEMLDAAELLHAKYEAMVRILRPVVKEVDEYHKVLYVIYHKYMPSKDYKAINGVISDLYAKADACINAKLPKRLEPKTEEYKKTATDLTELTKTLKEKLATNDGAIIDDAIEKMHSKYQDLEKLFN